MKRCSRCKQEKLATLDVFVPGTGTNGLASWCRECHNTYQREKRAIGRPPRLTERERFDAKIKTRASGCIEWVAAIDASTGYGVFTAAGRVKIGAHRQAWVFAHGAIPTGLGVLHRCDNRRCVNPAHLFHGTAKDNADDCASKGRSIKGVAHHNAKLDARKVRRVRALYKGGLSMEKIALRFGVSWTAVRSIMQGKTWRHIVD